MAASETMAVVSHTAELIFAAFALVVVSETLFEDSSPFHSFLYSPPKVRVKLVKRAERQGRQVDPQLAPWAKRLPRKAKTFGASYFGRELRFSDTSRHHVATVLAELEGGAYPDLLSPRGSHPLDRLGAEATIVDVGANFGAFSIAARLRWPLARIFSFEALPPTCACLQHNLVDNFGTNASIVSECMAVSGDGAEARFVVRKEDSGGGSAAYRSFDGFGSDHVQYQLRTMTLDALLERHGIRHVHLLKIDCEGCEHAVLRASRKLAHVDAVVAEFHLNDNLESQGHSFSGLKAFLRSMNPKMRIYSKDMRMHNA